MHWRASATPVRIGVIAYQLGHHLFGHIGHGLARIERTKTGGHELLLEIPVRTAKGRAGRGQHQLAHAVGMKRNELLRHHATDGMANEVSLFQAEMIHQAQERIGEP